MLHARLTYLSGGLVEFPAWRLLTHTRTARDPQIPGLPLEDPAGSVNISVPVSTITLAGQAPAVSSEFVLSPGAGNLTFTGHVPTIAVGLNLTPTTGNIILSGQTPTLSSDFLYTPGTANVTLSGQVPSVSQSIVLALPVSGITLIGQVPTVQVTANIPVPVSILTFTGQVPVITQSSSTPERFPVGAQQGYNWKRYYKEKEFWDNLFPEEREAAEAVTTSSLLDAPNKPDILAKVYQVSVEDESEDEFLLCLN